LFIISHGDSSAVGKAIPWTVAKGRDRHAPEADNTLCVSVAGHDAGVGMPHIPVLQKEILEYLDPKPNENFIDATIGGGGHALEILKKIGPAGKLLGIDADTAAINGLAARKDFEGFRDRLILVCDNFVNLEKIIKENSFGAVRGIVADLGLSSDQLEASGGGFSFLKDEPLIMKFGEVGPEDLTAKKILNEWPEEALLRIFKEYGEERFAAPIAEKIVRARKEKPIGTTFEFLEIIKKSTPAWYHHRRLHPATKVFQALRIAVNNELDNLANFLPPAVKALEQGGRLAIISFHSLEDRIVKIFFRQLKQQNLLKILTKKSIRPSFGEIGDNPRSRSARLRAVLKI
jgi:16S rRNA (cytosine1402-N4)-methyltransferase